MIFMSSQQYHRACALIRDLCCNDDRPTGGCLLLDDGSVTICPQMQTQALVCRYFRDVLLEDRDGKAIKAEIMQTDHVRPCEVCGQSFRALSNRAKYCARFSKKAERERAAERKRKQRKRVTL